LKKKKTKKRAVGSPIYIDRCTRPDITYATGKVARPSKNPTMNDWKKR